MTLAHSKAEIRARLLAERKALSAEEAAQRSARVRERVLALPQVRQAEEILTYVSSKDNEVDTHAIIEWALGQGKRVLVPLTKGRIQLLWSRIEALHELAPGRFGILEPQLEWVRATEPDPDAVTLVPGTGFTRDGRRIGYGAGYYDYFLSTFEGPTIGLAYDFQMISEFPHEKHDIPLDIIVSESRVYGRKGTPRRA